MEPINSGVLNVTRGEAAKASLRLRICGAAASAAGAPGAPGVVDWPACVCGVPAVPDWAVVCCGGTGGFVRCAEDRHPTNMITPVHRPRMTFLLAPSRHPPPSPA